MRYTLATVSDRMSAIERRLEFHREILTAHPFLEQAAASQLPVEILGRLRLKPSRLAGVHAAEPPSTVEGRK